MAATLTRACPRPRSRQLPPSNSNSVPSPVHTVRSPSSPVTTSSSALTFGAAAPQPPPAPSPPLPVRPRATAACPRSLLAPYIVDAAVCCAPPSLVPLTCRRLGDAWMRAGCRSYSALPQPCPPPGHCRFKMAWALTHAAAGSTRQQGRRAAPEGLAANTVWGGAAAALPAPAGAPPKAAGFDPNPWPLEPDCTVPKPKGLLAAAPARQGARWAAATDDVLLQLLCLLDTLMYGCTHDFEKTFQLFQF